MLSCFLAGKLCLGLSLKYRIRILYSHYRHHTVSGIGSCKVLVLFLQESKLSCIAVYKLCELCLEACDMGSALLSENVVTESVNILFKRIAELDTALKNSTLCFTLKINLRCNLLFFLVFVLYKGNNSFRLMELFYNRNLISVITIMDGELRIEVCGLMES